MALDNFRKVNITLNKANQRVLETQIAKAGDVNGRELVVQITNNGVIEDQTGTALKLNWQHENGNQDSTNFKVVDIKTGRFSVYYPKEMLYKGKVDASIEIISNGQTTNSMNFKIIVQADVFNGEAGTVNGVFISLADVNKKLDDREKEYVELKNRQSNVENQFNDIKQEMTGKDVISAPEIIEARNGEETLNHRLRKFDDKLSTSVDTSENVALIKKQNSDLTDTQAFRQAIESAIAKSPIKSGWREPVVIDIPSGHYEIDDTILDETMDVLGGKFVFRGAGSQSTIIKFKPETEKFLIDNKAVIGNTTFEGIRFESNYKGKFMNAQGGAPGMAQSFIFEKCYWLYFKEIMNVTGNTMMSEVTFTDCKIKEMDATSTVFRFDNAQAVNWRFYGTEIESFEGVCFEFLKGTTISYYQGSIIPLATGTVFKVPSTADYNAFGTGNSPQIQLDGVRFELRTYSILLDIQQPNVNLRGMFTNCGMGGTNLTSDVNHKTIRTKGRGRFIFDNCENWSNYRAVHEVLSATDSENPLYIEFRNVAPNAYIIENSEVVYVGGNNQGASPIYNFVNTFIDSAVRLDGHNRFKRLMPIKKHSTSFRQVDNQLLQFDGTKSETKHEINLPQVLLTGIEYRQRGIGTYGQLEFNVKILDEETNTVFIDEDLVTTTTKVLKPSDTFIQHGFSKNGKLTVKITPISSTSLTGINLQGVLLLEY